MNAQGQRKDKGDEGGDWKGVLQPRNTKDGSERPEAGRSRRDLPLETSKGAWPDQHPGFRLLAS